MRQSSEYLFRPYHRRPHRPWLDRGLMVVVGVALLGSLWMLSCEPASHLSQPVLPLSYGVDSVHGVECWVPPGSLGGVWCRDLKR